MDAGSVVPARGLDSGEVTADPGRDDGRELDADESFELG